MAFFQLVEKDTGSRSKPLSCERSEFARRCQQMINMHPETGDDYVLVLIDDVQTDVLGSAWEFSQAPMMTVRNFAEKFSS